jgi:hypothetical protein
LTFLPSSLLTNAIPVLPASGLRIELPQMLWAVFKVAGVELLLAPLQAQGFPLLSAQTPISGEGPA